MGFGGKGAKPKPQSELQVQTSSSTRPVTWAKGTSRLFPNLIDYVDFQAHKQKQKAGKGFGGSVTTYTYTATPLLELCEGVVSGLGRGWKDKGEVADAGEFGFTLFTGTTPQAPWGYLVTAHPTHALSYPGTAYLAKTALDLGDTASIGFYSFETFCGLAGTAPGGVYDADCALLVLEFLSDVQAGVTFPIAFLDQDQLLSSVDAAGPGDSTYQTYCTAMGFGLSPALDEQEAAGEILERWCLCTNAAPVWTGYSLKMVPYGDEVVTGNGVTFLPDTAVRYPLTDSDYLSQRGGQGTVEETFSDSADAKNLIKLEIRDRNNAYTPVPIPWQDQVSIETLGRQEGELIQAHEICEPAMGGQVAALVGQRIVNIRNGYRFTLDPRFSLLEPMDILTLTCEQLGLVELPVRILTIEEDEDDRLTIEAEEFPGAVMHTTTTQGAGGTPTPVNSLDPPGSVNPPIILEPPSTLTGGPAQVWAAVSGGDGTDADPNWGGCTVYASIDDISYQAIGTIDSPARMGVLATASASYAGVNPQASSFDVNLAMSAGELQDVTEDEAAAAETLSYVEDAGGGNGEYLSYRDATLVSGNRYTVGGSLYRRLYGTAGPVHAIGSKYARLDENIFKFDLPAAWIGATLYFKFASFNIWGQAEEDIAALPSYTYVPAGTGFGGGTGGVPSTPTGLNATPGTQSVVLVWTANPASDNVTAYDVYRAPGLAAVFGASVLVGTVVGNIFPDSGLGVATAYTYFVKAKNSLGDSAASAGEDFTTTAATVGGGATAPITASQALAAGDQVNLHTVAGALRMRKANATDTTKPAHGFVKAAVANGAVGTFHGPGMINDALAGLTPGATYWLSATAGLVVTAVPATSGNGDQEVGQALSATELLFLPRIMVEVE